MSRKKKKNKDLLKFGALVLLIIFGFLLGTNREKLTRGLFSGRVLVSEEVSAKELKKLLENKNFTFINVHTPYEGEIEKTDIFIDYDMIMAGKDKLPKDKNAEIILYCKSGRMSADALTTFKNLGYKNVRHLKGGMDSWKDEGFGLLDLSNLPNQVLPEEGFELPISWGDIGPKLVSLGVIESGKFEKAVEMTDAQKEILLKGSSVAIKIDSASSQFVVDMLWAFGLAQKSKVYDEGPMGKEYAKDVGNFASTGGWSLAKGDAVTYLNKYDLIPLTRQQQDKVAEISKYVFRPCCGNPTWFPDCNHGMAALAAIELMVYQGIPETEIYKNVLKLNSFWFPSHYLTLGTYFARQGISWDKIDARLALSEEYSSGQAAGKLLQKVGPLPFDTKFGGGCGA
ncbi:hypothetical protein A2865_01390 [Candidatus Woesebacteria bacterium RIFCSPHIGHO2_01_FULL_39_17]|uniref:Rhodanese domain-containing protein n=3 Tax=Candidatus Woeseibacteriota TaxID=1752722 RepID=A0A0G0NCK1_9BACT|nr:MAG: hypothetical protein US72_C0003G0072 [Microgenomates group bacterium GW2011_GWC1_38_12]KKQ94497.1 MAG: hypothetical protein UT19_C0001G0029 [Candidatus Woesebacteria bacterium GW2011_GWB1_39_10b]KKR13894.1 MAG: hypothetical protein UT40_C0008G0018 [Candidatus Woesebacteria bacterium GW2011_GWA1_39_21b]OGM23051.1 MAG: hypothetical protein A2865_01390 [Candidatus Woesebacteria bacterium RIFCSPHIGHO2_01_FULL_39_17]OGM65562.1 MAG: hypothetical protein A3A52_01640 [Candidatus Woesebacteria b